MLQKYISVRNIFVVETRHELILQSMHTIKLKAFLFSYFAVIHNRFNKCKQFETYTYSWYSFQLKSYQNIYRERLHVI